MKNSHDISFKRIIRLMYKEIVIAKRMFFRAILTLTVFILISTMLGMQISSVYFLYLYGGGFLFTDLTFREMHKTRQAYKYLTLPCSNLERFISKWLLTSVVYAIGLVTVFMLLSLLSVMLNRILFNYNMISLNSLYNYLWSGVGRYIIFQSVILLGAATFKRNGAAFNTIFYVGCFYIVMCIFIFMVIWKFICPDCFFIDIAAQVIALLRAYNTYLWMVLAPICWFITYLKITEYEIS